VRRGDGGQPVGAATAQEGTEMRSIGKAIGGMSVSAVTSGVRCSRRAGAVRRRWRKAGVSRRPEVSGLPWHLQEAESMGHERSGAQRVCPVVPGGRSEQRAKSGREASLWDCANTDNYG
jgi:hypothetical protein